MLLRIDQRATGTGIVNGIEDSFCSQQSTSVFVRVWYFEDEDEDEQRRRGEGDGRRVKLKNAEMTKRRNVRYDWGN